MKTVIYHSADYDGIFCREIAKHFLGEKDVNYIGWNFGDAKIPFPDDGEVYVLDLSPECLSHTPQRAASALIWIDHHKTSIEKWPKQILGYRIDGVAACRLAWQWFSHVCDQNETHCHPALPTKQNFFDRTVSEPIAVRLAGEYDIWDKRDERADVLQYGLRCVDDPNWKKLFEERNAKGQHCTAHLFEILEKGKVAQSYAQKIDADLVTHRSYRMDWEGLKWLVLNTGRFNSLTFAALDKPDTGHDALLGYMFNGKAWTASLYHAKHRTDLDLSTIAVKYNGGGHRGACGFTCQQLPFLK